MFVGSLQNKSLQTIPIFAGETRETKYSTLERT
jgi:hypothetical protein